MDLYTSLHDRLRNNGYTGFFPSSPNPSPGNVSSSPAIVFDTPSPLQTANSMSRHEIRREFASTQPNTSTPARALIYDDQSADVPSDERADISAWDIHDHSLNFETSPHPPKASDPSSTEMTRNYDTFYAENQVTHLPEQIASCSATANRSEMKTSSDDIQSEIHLPQAHSEIKSQHPKSPHFKYHHSKYHHSKYHHSKHHHSKHHHSKHRKFFEPTNSSSQFRDSPPTGSSSLGAQVSDSGAKYFDQPQTSTQFYKSRYHSGSVAPPSNSEVAANGATDLKQVQNAGSTSQVSHTSTSREPRNAYDTGEFISPHDRDNSPNLLRMAKRKRKINSTDHRPSKVPKNLIHIEDDDDPVALVAQVMEDEAFARRLQAELDREDSAALQASQDRHHGFIDDNVSSDIDVSSDINASSDASDATDNEIHGFLQNASAHLYRIAERMDILMRPPTYNGMESRHDNSSLDYEELHAISERLGDVKTNKLTTAQLAQLPTRTYKRAQTDGGQVEECHICMGEYTNRQKIRRLPCFHEYHRKCIDMWLKKNATCPVCRVEVTV